MDLYSLKIIGWELSDHMKESLVMGSLKKALAARKVVGKLIIHSDRGGQYAGSGFRRLLDTHKLSQSMSDTASPYDNVHMESYFSRFKAELLEGGAFNSAEDSQTEIFEFIEMYYNPIRLHSSLGYVSPILLNKTLTQSYDYCKHYKAWAIAHHNNDPGPSWPRTPWGFISHGSSK